MMKALPVGFQYRRITEVLEGAAPVIEDKGL
jgi:hypothetical protein